MNRKFASYADFAQEQGIVLKMLGHLFELMKFEDEHPEEFPTIKKMKEEVTINRINWFNGLNEMLGFDVCQGDKLSDVMMEHYCQQCGMLSQSGDDKDNCYAGGTHSFLCDALYDPECSESEQCEDAMCHVCHESCDVDDCQTCREATECQKTGPAT